MKEAGRGNRPNHGHLFSYEYTAAAAMVTELLNKVNQKVVSAESASFRAIRYQNPPPFRQLQLQHIVLLFNLLRIEHFSDTAFQTRKIKAHPLVTFREIEADDRNITLERSFKDKNLLTIVRQERFVVAKGKC
jgi:hypothetical protein